MRRRYLYLPGGIAFGVVIGVVLAPVIVGAQQVVSVDAIRPGSALAAAVDQARTRP